MSTFRILLVGAALVALPSTASAYTASLQQSTTVDGENHILSFGGLPNASGTVSVSIGLEGDFSYGALTNPEGSVNYADGDVERRVERDRIRAEVDDGGDGGDGGDGDFSEGELVEARYRGGRKWYKAV